MSEGQDAKGVTEAPEAAGKEALSKDGGAATGAEEADAASQADAQSEAEADDGRYPERASITGGWYGGEIGLQQFIKVPSSSWSQSVTHCISGLIRRVLAVLVLLHSW